MTEERISDRAYVEAILREQNRAIEMASEEREKAANVERQDRERSAQALRIELERARFEGDERLRDHISGQVAQLRAAQESADKLEHERVSKVSVELTNTREKLEGAIRDEHQYVESRLTAIEAVIATRLQASNEAAKIQRDELARRLDHLNNEAQRIAQRDVSFTSREAFEALVKAFDEYRVETNRALLIREGGEKAGATARSLLFAILGIFIAVVAVVVTVANALTN